MKSMDIKNAKKQKGSMLLEGLIGILIFSLGVLSLVGLQSVAVKNVTQSKYRSDAAYLADKFIAQMWVDDKTNLAANYATGGARYITWRNNIVNNRSLPGVTTSPARNLPIVTMVPEPTTGSVTATITLFWQLPGEMTPHQYITVAQIGK
jgi:type IV pilus assembly protein PilV